MSEIRKKFLGYFSRNQHEIIESIDMMRLLDNDIDILAMEVTKSIIGVDQLKDISLVEARLMHDPLFPEYRKCYEKGSNRDASFFYAANAKVRNI